MPDIPRLLVVDDEAAICQACRRVLGRQGYEVDESTDAHEGLRRAKREPYAGILLDVRMPGMDGIEFLEALRDERPDVPVIIMTGFPSIPNAASAVRLGASDYIIKPFTPEQITQSVRRILARRTTGNGRATEAPAGVAFETSASGECLFFDESWLRPEIDGSALVGAVLGQSPAAPPQAVCMPTLGEAIYQGLPLAGATLADGRRVVVPSPVSGVVVGLNELLGDDPSALLDDPCGRGWIACVCTTRLDDEMARCRPRRLILLNADEASATRQSEQLSALGCRVHVVRNAAELTAATEDPDHQVLLLDAASVGADGPALAGRAKAAMPSMRTVVVASAASQWEAAYREQGIFYYAVEPFGDGEIVDILDAAFRPQATLRRASQRREDASQPIQGIRVINRNGHKVQLLAAPGVLRRDGGLGLQIRQRLAERAFPIVTTPGDADLTPAAVLAAAAASDRVMVLRIGDVQRLPGSLVRDTKAEYVAASRENAGRVTTLVVQPDPVAGGLSGLEQRTVAALADHIVQEMAAY